MSALPTACVIGAGSSGIAAVKALAHARLRRHRYEKCDRVGGNWVFGNTNGMSSAYRSLHINTSRERMEYSDFPMPKSYPDFPHHTHIAKYFDDYVDHFGVRDRIRFETGVEHAARRPDGVWEVALENGETHRYDALLVANGHHWDPRWPEPAFPGAEAFEGVQMHSHDYKGDDPDFFRDKTRRRARDGQLGDGHRGRGELRRGAHLPRRPPRRARPPQVHVRPADRPDRAARRRSRSRSGARCVAGDAQGLPWATWSATGCRSPTTASATRTRPSPTTSSRGWRTARSRRSRTSRR